MIISKEYKFIFFAIPHTGTSSIQRMLEPHVCKVPHGWCSFSKDKYSISPDLHYVPNYVRAHLLIRGEPNWNKYCKVTIVRNPWDRFVANMLAINNYNKTNPSYSKYSLPNPTYKNFEEYVQSGFYDGMLQQEFMYTFDNEVVMDFVLKFENLKDDTIKLFKKFNLPIPKQLRHDNNWNITPDSKKSKRKHYTEYYTEQWMIDAVAEKEPFVIENYGYKYGKDGDRWR